MTPTLPPGTDLKRLKMIYEWAERRYLKSLPLEHFMESIPQATQREITLASFALVRVSRPDVQCFNELLVQYPKPGQDPDKPGQVVPDNMVVIHHRPIVAEGSYMTPLQPVGPFLVLEYVSKASARKDEEVSYAKYEKELKVPYYLLFYSDADEFTLFRLGEKGYSATPPNANGRCPIPELELEVGLLGKWVRYWFRGELLPLPADLLKERDAERVARLAAEKRAADAEAELAKLREELAKAKGRE
ncbi:MAG: Uma2 family endonuclease [Planctomycetes bacterium]|nr:Uma2 family endonuclease [Planctomycetota bacterium]